ncbi:MAG: hypothetical protein K6E59_02285 [Bacilli bacterium]|nr:hypothetical protein [Bacilli bacterium]
MRIHVRYDSHPLAELTLFTKFRKEVRSQKRTLSIYVYPQRTFRLLPFLKRCVRRLWASNLYLFLKPSQIDPKVIKGLNKIQRANVLVIVDAEGKPIDSQAQDTLHLARYPVCVNRCPTPIPGIKTHQSEQEESITALVSLLCCSYLHYGCDYSSCLGSTMFIDEKGNCKRCKKEETPFGNIRDKRILEKLRNTEDLKDLLREEVPFRKRCMEKCPHFPLCKGYCPRSEDRCRIKTLLPVAEQAREKLTLNAGNVFDEVNAIYWLAFRK